MSVLPKIGNKVSLTQQAYDAIKDAIITNKFKPGELLIEEKLAEQLDISRTPLRGALKKLSYEHLVEINSSRNVIVSNIKESEVDDITVVREALETTAVKQLEGKITKEEIEALEQLVKEQLRAAKNCDYDLFISYEYEFHLKIAEATKNKWIYYMGENLNTIVQRYLVLSGSLNKYSEIAAKEHEDIVKAIKNGDFAKASEVMRSHIVKVSNRMLK